MLEEHFVSVHSPWLCGRRLLTFFIPSLLMSESKGRGEFEGFHHFWPPEQSVAIRARRKRSAFTEECASTWRILITAPLSAPFVLSHKKTRQNERLLFGVWGWTALTLEVLWLFFNHEIIKNAALLKWKYWQNEWLNHSCTRSALIGDKHRHVGTPTRRAASACSSRLETELNRG